MEDFFEKSFAVLPRGGHSRINFTERNIYAELQRNICLARRSVCGG